MCTVLLPLGVNPTAVNKYININSNINNQDKKSLPLDIIQRWLNSIPVLTSHSPTSVSILPFCLFTPLSNNLQESHSMNLLDRGVTMFVSFTSSVSDKTWKKKKKMLS
jgi:hypothetical protein